MKTGPVVTDCKVSGKEEVFHRCTDLDRTNSQILGGIQAVGVMRGIIKNSGQEQTFHRDSESVALEDATNTGRRFFDLIIGSKWILQRRPCGLLQ